MLILEIFKPVVLFTTQMTIIMVMGDDHAGIDAADPCAEVMVLS